MRRLLYLFLVLLILPLSGMTPASAPPPDPPAIWTWITETHPYSDWQHWPDHFGFQPGASPHGPRNKVFVNDRLRRQTTAPVAGGSMVVKENFSIARELLAITVMLKVPGFHPEGNDWYWVKYLPDGRAVTHGKPESCINCHSSLEENDYLMVHFFEKEE